MFSWFNKNTANPRTGLFRFLSELDIWTRTHPLTPLVPLTWTLLCSLISTGPIWFILAMIKLILLFIFACVLSPAWVQIGWFYLTSENLRRNIRYGDNPRNFLDIYFPPSALHKTQEKCPVVIYLTGGAWIIGYKAWGTLIARELVDFDIICVTPDYRNFPQGNMLDMLTDVNQAIAWVFAHIEKFGGDINNIYLVGQSAGAQLLSMAMLRQMEVAEEERMSLFGWSSTNLKGFVGLSGPYDIESMQNHFHHCGLHRQLLARIFGDQNSIANYSPSSLALRHRGQHRKLPPCWFFHGEKDTSVPPSSTVDFASVLAHGFETRVRCKIYAGKTHTDPIVEDLLYLGKVYTAEEHFISDLVDIIKGFEEMEDGQKRREARLEIKKEQNTMYSFCGNPSQYPSCPTKLMCLVHPFLFRIAKVLNPF